MNWSGPERRRSPRLAMNLAATMRERGRNAFSVRLVDISALGCRIELYSDLAPDTWVWLKLPSFEPRYSRIAWCRGGFAGIEFEAPLHETVVDVLAGVEHLPTPAETAELQAIARRCRDAATRLCDESDPTMMELLALAADCEAAERL